MTEPDRRAWVCDEIVRDMERDVAAFDGRPLDGRTVAEIHGTLAAAVASLAKVVRTLLPEPTAQVEPRHWDTLLVDRNDTVWRRVGLPEDRGDAWEVHPTYVSRSTDPESARHLNVLTFKALHSTYGPLTEWRLGAQGPLGHWPSQQPIRVHLEDDPPGHPGHRVGCARLGRGGGVAWCTCGVIERRPATPPDYPQPGQYGPAEMYQYRGDESTDVAPLGRMESGEP